MNQSINQSISPGKQNNDQKPLRSADHDVTMAGQKSDYHSHIHSDKYTPLTTDT